MASSQSESKMKNNYSKLYSSYKNNISTRETIGISAKAIILLVIIVIVIATLVNGVKKVYASLTETNKNNRDKQE